MNATRPSQKGKLVWLALTATAILGFQNCGGKLEIPDLSELDLNVVIPPIDVTNPNDPALKTADHDPLRVADEEAVQSQDEALKGTGPVYDLVRVIRAGEFYPVSAGAFRLRFDEYGTWGTTVNDIVMETVKFTAMQSCDTVFSGQAKISRYKGRPLAYGSLEVVSLMESKLQTLMACPEILQDELGLANPGSANGYGRLLQSVKSYSVRGRSLILYTDDGTQLVYSIGVGHALPKPVINAPITAVMTGWEGNICLEANGTGCGTKITKKSLSARFLEFKMDGTFYGSYSGLEFAGKFRVTTPPIIAGFIGASHTGSRTYDIQVSEFAILHQCSQPAYTVAACKNTGADREALATLVRNMKRLIVSNDPAQKPRVETALGGKIFLQLPYGID